MKLNLPPGYSVATYPSWFRIDRKDGSTALRCYNAANPSTPLQIRLYKNDAEESQALQFENPAQQEQYINTLIQLGEL